MSRTALGRGLGALIPERRPVVPGAVMLPISQIAPNPSQPRKHFEPAALEELVQSVKDRGVLQPVLVKQTAAGYELIAGERRWRAAAMAGMTEIPARVMEAGREESLVLALIENIQREDLNPMEAAHAYQGLAEEFDLSHEQIARLVGKDRASVTNFLRLLKLPMAIQEDVGNGRLSMGHARALLGLPTRERQLAARDQVLARGLSVRETEQLARRPGRPPGPGRKKGRRSSPGKDANLAAVENSLVRRLGTKVVIEPDGEGGSIRVHFHSLDELNRLVDLLLAEGT